jgi:hypothetical protein
MSGWREEYEGGGPEAERLVFERLAVDIMQVQMTTKRRAKRTNVQRAFHAKAVFTATDAELCFIDDLPTELRAGFAQPGKRYTTIVRLSNADGAGQADYKPDLRGIALRVKIDDKVTHDLLATNFPVSHARNARQFVAFAKATAGGTLGRIVGLTRLAFQFGPSEVVRMVSNVRRARRTVPSLALETYWSRGAIRWGQTLAVRYLLRPAVGAPPAPRPDNHDPDFLSKEFARRLASGEVRFELWLQKFVDARATSIEDTAVEWTEQVSPPVKVATLIVRKPGSTAPPTLAESRLIECLPFNPWNTTDEFRPLGNLNRARKSVYDASSAHRLGHKWNTVTPLRNRVLSELVPPIFSLVNRFIAWHKLPLRLSLLNLDAFRFVLRRKNLIDTEPREAPPAARPVPPPIPEDARWTRQADGRYTDISAPEMGTAGAAFGRNLPPILRPDLFDTPSPIQVSRDLLARKEFIPARSLNILAAAWIQFQVHDWVNHERYLLGKDDVVVPLPPGMTWKSSVNGPEENVMRIAGNSDRIESEPGQPAIFRNTETHWWDSSQLYGTGAEKTQSLREGAKIRLESGYLPRQVNGLEATGFNQSWWLGLSAMHLIFAREHNLLCDELRATYRDWDDNRVFQTARLIVSALIAKIHTVEWTPAILATEAIDVALKINWQGPPANDWMTRAGLWMLDVHSLAGIPKTTPDHSGVPYSLTEDFVTVYRLHPLLPDDYCFFDCTSGQKLSNETFLNIQGANTDRMMREKSLANVLYSFGIAYPGAITLHNFPNSLRKFERDGELIDLAVVDLVRTRRRGVPRYNDFRAGLHKPRIRRWEDLTADPEDVRLLKDVYGSIEMVKTM